MRLVSLGFIVVIVRNPQCVYAGLNQESVYLAFKFSVVKARLIGLCFALALSKHLLLQVTGHYRCSSSGISGCECLFLGACDAHEKPKDGLDIKKHACHLVWNCSDMLTVLWLNGTWHIYAKITL